MEIKVAVGPPICNVNVHVKKMNIPKRTRATAATHNGNCCAVSVDGRATGVRIGYGQVLEDQRRSVATVACGVHVAGIGWLLPITLGMQPE